MGFLFSRKYKNTKKASGNIIPQPRISPPCTMHPHSVSFLNQSPTPVKRHYPHAVSFLNRSPTTPVKQRHYACSLSFLVSSQGGSRASEGLQACSNVSYQDAKVPRGTRRTGTAMPPLVNANWPRDSYKAERMADWIHSVPDAYPPEGREPWDPQDHPNLYSFLSILHNLGTAPCYYICLFLILWAAFSF